ncbi:MAG: M56 family metallopeptidase [Ruminococcaceae bacterium]|nr:M56 family metallopeptidase [Oscillospiraceae bacterium]
MHELFKTVLILSFFGFGITALLLCLKPITAKKFPAKWQYYVWIAVLLSMVIPIYKLFPANEIYKIPMIPQAGIVQQIVPTDAENVPAEVEIIETPIMSNKPDIEQKPHIKIFDLLSYMWLFGMCIYLVVIIASYIIYIIRKRKNAVSITENTVFNNVKKELRIKRHIRIRMSEDFESPMLVGVLFPVVYIPSKEISDENMRMIFLHELTHYKRKDLLIKWFALFVNAVHWFNPLTYLLCANVGEACEVSCDMSVTKNMSEEEQKTYMKTILDLAQ